MSDWGKIIALYMLVAAAAFGRLALSAEKAAFYADQINLKGDYLNRPLVADVYGDVKSASFQKFWIQLATFRYARQLIVGRDETKVRTELAQLREEHRTLMMTRNGTGSLDDSVERSYGTSAWSMSVTQNISRQADLRARLERTAGRWDAAHPLALRFKVRRGKKFLVRLELPNTRLMAKEQVAYR